jgi:hypothetical protein
MKITTRIEVAHEPSKRQKLWGKSRRVFASAWGLLKPSVALGVGIKKY